ncbi:MAG: sugar ABC transporter ATP-binding protein [Pseudomonadota bacterium]
MTEPLVRLTKVTKEYFGVPAIRAVDFTVLAGEVHALVGENGAGKSTLTKVMVGITAPTSGTIAVDGTTVNLRSPADALSLGLAMVFQETSLVPSMTVAQNLYLGQEHFFTRLRGMYIAAQQFLQSLNFNVDPMTPVAGLGAAQKQMVEIARAVLRKARLIIFDEPTAALTPEEKHYFFALIDRLKTSGVAVVFISHAIEEALQIADRITVLRDGEIVTTDAASSFDRASVIRAMVGRTLSDELYTRKDGQTRPPQDLVLSVQNLSMGSMVRNTSFSVYAGQVTGIFGLIGSGRTETAKVVAGVLKRNLFHGGKVSLFARAVRYRMPRQAMLDGVVYVTEDRKIEGFFEGMSIAENIFAGYLTARGPRIVSPTQMRDLASTWRDKLNIRAIDPGARVVELSGGNQQKVVVAKSLVQRPKLVIFDEPTRGVDVGAIAEIHTIIKGLADDGLAVMVISSYLPEVLNLSDRILVARQGRIVEEFAPHDATEETIMYAAVH